MSKIETKIRNGLTPGDRSCKKQSKKIALQKYGRNIPTLWTDSK